MHNVHQILNQALQVWPAKKVAGIGHDSGLQHACWQNCLRMLDSIFCHSRKTCIQRARACLGAGASVQHTAVKSCLGTAGKCADSAADDGNSTRPIANSTLQRAVNAGRYHGVRLSAIERPSAALPGAWQAGVTAAAAVALQEEAGMSSLKRQRQGEDGPKESHVRCVWEMH